MRFDSVVIGEAIVPDARGALTVIGFNQRLITTQTFPFMHKFALAVVLTDEIESGFEAISSESVSIRLVSPSGAVQFAASQPVGSGEKQWLDLPALANLVVEVPVVVEAPGVYTVEVSLTLRDVVVDTIIKKLYIFSPPTDTPVTFPRSAFLAMG